MEVHKQPDVCATSIITTPIRIAFQSSMSQSQQIDLNAGYKFMILGMIHKSTLDEEISRSMNSKIPHKLKIAKSSPLLKIECESL